MTSSSCPQGFTTATLAAALAAAALAAAQSTATLTAALAAAALSHDARCRSKHQIYEPLLALAPKMRCDLC